MFFRNLFKKKDSVQTSENTPIRKKQPFGALFWFDWNLISENGHGSYGAYVYEQLIPFLSPHQTGYIPGMYMFFDGDCLPQGKLRIPYDGVEESLCINSVVERGVEYFYVVAIYREHGIDFDVLHKNLGMSKVIGYTGKTSCTGMKWKEFYEFASQMSLPLAAQITDRRFEKINFYFLSDQKLNELGFTVIAQERN